MRSDSHSAFLLKAAIWLGWIAVAVNVALMAARAATAISFSEPLFVVTSGAEEDSALSFWKYIEGRTVFEDPHRLPFVGAAYNWLYYAFYGEAIRPILRVFDLGYEWLPTIGRYVSIVITAICAGVAVFTLRRIGPTESGLRQHLILFGLFLFLGPLVGFWAISLNVELAATLCALLAAAAIFQLFDTRPMAAVVLACVFGYLAWSFKQSHIFVAGALVLFLLVRREWRLLVVVLFFFGLGWGAAMVIGSEAYLKMLLFKGTDKTLELGRLNINLRNLVLKTTPVLAAAALLLVPLFRAQYRISDIRNSTPVFFSLCGVIVTALTIPMSAKQGASENYYFVFIVFLVLLIFAVLRALQDRDLDLRPWHGLLCFGWILNIVATLSVLTGMNGVVSVKSWHDQHIAARPCVQELPGPMLPVLNPYFTLPWMSKAEPRFNVFYNYPYDRRAKRWFEFDGLNGLVKNGYFAAILLSPGDNTTVDGASLSGHYREIADYCPQHPMSLFLRNGLPDPK